MRGWRLVLFSSLICLPAVLVIVGGAVLALGEVPRAIRREAAAIRREYREMAEDFMEHPAWATCVGARPKGLRTAKKINGIPWAAEVGCDKDGRRTRIWFRDAASEWRAMEVETIRAFPYELVFYGGGLIVAVVLLGLSALAVVGFVRFMRERDDFLAATAHDLTTPLVGMRRMIGRDDEEVRRLNGRMLLLVDNIKDFLKLGGRRKEPDLKSVDIVALAHEAYSLFSADYADSEGGPVVFAFSSPASANNSNNPDNQTIPLVLADSTLTLQILWNLFGNDLKYAAPHGKVEVRFSSDEKNVTVEFADQGPGMTPRQMRKAFDRYYRAKTVLETGKGGFGIGLCTAREFARAMGGDLTVRANVPRGCVFALALPAALDIHT